MILTITAFLALAQSLTAAFNGTITQASMPVQDILNSNASYSNISAALSSSQPLSKLFNQSGANLTFFAPSGMNNHFEIDMNRSGDSGASAVVCFDCQ